MPSRSPSSYRLAVLLLLLLMAIGWFVAISGWQPVKRETATAVVNPPPVPKRPTRPAPPKTQDPKPIRISTKGTVRLKPGETAVMSYWESELGANGIVLVTPATMPDGNIRLSARILKVPDTVVEQAAAEDLFPGVFANEHSGAIGPQRLNEFMRSVSGIDNVNKVSMPTAVTKPGHLVTLSLMVETPDGPRIGQNLGLEAQSLTDGGYDLSMSFEKEGPAPD